MHQVGRAAAEQRPQRVAECPGLAQQGRGHVDGVARHHVGRQGLLEPRERGGVELLHGQAELLGRVGREHASCAGIADADHPGAARGGLREE